MNFELSDIQQQLANSARRFVSGRYDRAQRLRSLRDKKGFCPDIWHKFSELGWLGIGLPETSGGFGDAVDLMVIMEALGSGCIVEPFAANVALAGQVLALAGCGMSRELLSRMVTGEIHLALGFAEQQARFDLHDVQTRAQRTNAGWAISGRKRMVLNACAAETLIVVARTSGADREQAGLTLLAVPASTDGITMQPYHNHDGASAADVTFDNVAVPDAAVIGINGEALAPLERAIETATMAECASACGAMDWLVSATVDYLKTRVQFGRPLAGFQTLQHRLVDMYIAVEEMRSLTMWAAMTLESGADSEIQKAISAAKIHLATSGRKVGEEAVQLHGAIGMTDEFPIGHYYKRILAAATLYGDGDYHLGRLGGLLANEN